MLRRALLALCLSLLLSPLHAATQITVWNYYHSPPFYDAPGNAGLTPALVAYLNQALAGRYQLELRNVPRARLNALLQKHAQGIVFLAPSFAFSQSAYRGYEWSPPLLLDRQELVSPAENPVEFQSADTLKPLRTGGILGHVYPALQAQIDDGSLSVYRVSSEGQILDMLLAGRLDAGTVAASSLDYWMQQHPALAPRLHRSSRNLGQFTRHLLYTPGLQTARIAIDQALREAAGDPAWRAVFAQYGLQALQAPR